MSLKRVAHEVSANFGESLHMLEESAVKIATVTNRGAHMAIAQSNKSKRQVVRLRNPLVQ
jgi:hypothetical protein